MTCTNPHCIQLQWGYCSLSCLPCLRRCAVFGEPRDISVICGLYFRYLYSIYATLVEVGIQGVAEIRSLILPFCLKIQTKTKRTEYKFCSHNSAVLRGDDQEGLGRIADFSPV